ncbi:MAG: hypothetical protein U0359_40360 [Byssovorax sp.]
MRQIAALALTMTMFLPACAEKKPAPEGPAKTTAATTASAKAALTPEQLKEAKKKAEEEHEKAEREAHKRNAHCPMYADGSTAAIADVDGGVELTVTAKADAAVKLIRADAKLTSEATKNPPKEHHDEDPGYGARKYGRCPVVARNTTVDFAEVPGGAKITVKAKAPGDVEWLRRETRERADELAGKDAPERLAHCPSAVKTVDTFITDTQGTVSITIVSRDEALKKEIRERGKYITDLIAKDPKEVKRSGALKAGEGTGRCPIILNDVTVTTEEIPLGVKFTLKPDDHEDAEWLLDELKERGERFLH